MEFSSRRNVGPEIMVVDPGCSEFFETVSSYSRMNSSSSITPSKKLSGGRVLASLKVDIFVSEKNIAIAVPSENCLPL